MFGHRFTHLGKREILQLADTFASDVKAFTDLLEREFVFAIQPEPQANDLGLAFIEGR